MAYSPQPLQGLDWLKKLNDSLDAIDDAELIDLASDAETIAGALSTKAVTPAGLFSYGATLDALSFMGRSGSGACTLTGVKVGDLVNSVTGVSGSAVAGDQSSKFQNTITVADQIQQSNAGNLSANTYLALLQRKS